MPLDLTLDFAHALDPVAFAEDRLGFVPDPWQARVLRSRASWILLNCCRQSGKSTTTAVVALHTALYDPGLILLVSPTLRQSKELFAKTAGFQVCSLLNTPAFTGHTTGHADFPASGSRTRVHAFAHGTSRPSRIRRTSPRVS